MPRDAAQSRTTRALGAFVLSAFVFGVASGPFRTCLSHPGHQPAQQMADVAPAHMAAHHETPSDHQLPHREHEGCSCLGQCSLEHPQFLPTTSIPAVAHAPMVPRAMAVESRRVQPRPDRFSHPLARPPPAVV